MRSKAATIQEALEYLNYPKKKDEILEYARDHRFTEDIISDLQNISDRTYENSLDLRNEFEKGLHSEPARHISGESSTSFRSERGQE
ncbi:DUF2795 domain-containing protein [Methanolobus halotolerans]|uniref:DUF2795 domain-containing protein n=1 Tax=Methanolobus halotolerans TaxID=2052935 RepID=A0A4E0Q740_9EURY|nr:DUF2795 domain-containing protein [Methanolobus halotolerans]TGC10707.1 hypothetical protein CUN85_04350 [Methanolobus halotolerans]